MDTNQIKQKFLTDEFMDNSLKQKTIEMLGGWELFTSIAPAQSKMLLEENMLDIKEHDLVTLSQYFGQNIKAISAILLKESKAHGHKSPEYFLAQRVPTLRNAGITADDVIEILTKRQRLEDLHLLLQVIYQLVAKNLFDQYTVKYSNTLN